MLSGPVALCVGDIVSSLAVVMYTVVTDSTCALHMSTFTHRRSIAERGGCFQRRLFVSLSVCRSTRQLPND